MRRYDRCIVRGVGSRSSSSCGTPSSESNPDTASPAVFALRVRVPAWRLFLFGLSTALLLALMAYLSFHSKATRLDEFHRFDQADIDGRISWLGPPFTSRSVRFRIEGMEETFSFYPMENRPNGGFETFDEVASVGSLVVKPSGADSLVVEADGRRHEFRFWRGD